MLMHTVYKQYFVINNKGIFVTLRIAFVFDIAVVFVLVFVW